MQRFLAAAGAKVCALPARNTRAVDEMAKKIESKRI